MKQNRLDFIIINHGINKRNIQYIVNLELAIYFSLPTRIVSPMLKCLNS